MALTSSGQIDLNAMHVEAGGTTGTECTLNDADIRDMIDKASGAQMAFNEWYGASSVSYTTYTLTGTSYYAGAAAGTYKGNRLPEQPPRIHFKGNSTSVYMQASDDFYDYNENYTDSIYTNGYDPSNDVDWLMFDGEDDSSGGENAIPSYPAITTNHYYDSTSANGINEDEGSHTTGSYIEAYYNGTLMDTFDVLTTGAGTPAALVTRNWTTAPSDAESLNIIGSNTTPSLWQLKVYAAN
jgi:hypothetical protein